MALQGWLPEERLKGQALAGSPRMVPNGAAPLKSGTKPRNDATERNQLPRPAGQCWQLGHQWLLRPPRRSRSIGVPQWRQGWPARR